eukprot:189708-Rhodomonas_salina.2
MASITPEQAVRTEENRVKALALKQQMARVAENRMKALQRKRKHEESQAVKSGPTPVTIHKVSRSMDELKHGTEIGKPDIPEFESCVGCGGPAMEHSGTKKVIRLCALCSEAAVMSDVAGRSQSQNQGQREVTGRKGRAEKVARLREEADEKVRDRERMT